MKRIFSIFLCVLLLCSTFVFSVSAAESETHHLHGMYEFNDTIYPPVFGEDGLYGYRVEFTERRLDSSGNERFGDTYDYIEFLGDSSYFEFVWSNPEDSYFVYDSDYGWHELYKNRKIVYFDNVAVDLEFYTWFNANATELYCDGSTCPVGDTDADGYCEDCYRAMRMVAPDEGSPVYPSDLPSLPYDVDNANYEHIAFNSGGDIMLYSYIPAGASTGDVFWKVYGNSNTDKVIMDAQKSSATGNAYKLVNNEWVYSGILSGDYEPCNRTDLIYSSTIIYDENGEYFFPLTLWAQILKVEQGAMKVEVPKMTNSAVSLVVCGIGCLALLISLVLLVKVLRKYL